MLDGANWVEVYHEALTRAFNIFDKKKQGYLDKTAFVRVLQSIGKPMSDMEIDDMFGATQFQEDDKIQLSEFLLMNGVDSIKKSKTQDADDMNQDCMIQRENQNSVIDWGDRNQIVAQRVLNY